MPDENLSISSQNQDRPSPPLGGESPNAIALCFLPAGARICSGFWGQSRTSHNQSAARFAELLPMGGALNSSPRKLNSYPGPATARLLDSETCRRILSWVGVLLHASVLGKLIIHHSGVLSQMPSGLYGRPTRTPDKYSREGNTRREGSVWLPVIYGPVHYASVIAGQLAATCGRLHT